MTRNRHSSKSQTSSSFLDYDNERRNNQTYVVVKDRLLRSVDTGTR